MEEMRAMVRGYYDLQKLRISVGNRIVATFKAKLGQEPSQKENELSAEGKMILANLRSEYKRLADGAGRVSTRLKQHKGLISSQAEFSLVAQYEKLLEAEDCGEKAMRLTLDGIPVYRDYLAGVKGVGTLMAGVIISEIDIAKARYASSLWKYAGLDVAPDGRGRSRRGDHLVDMEYTNKDGEPATRRSITFNPFLKTKLVGVLASSFLKAGRDNPYAAIYYGYRNRLENHPAHAEKTKGHRHNMAMRYMVKRFLADLYAKWRELEGLPVAPEYSEGKLGIRHAA